MADNCNADVALSPPHADWHFGQLSGYDAAMRGIARVVMSAVMVLSVALVASREVRAEPLVVGTVPVAPFIIKRDDGSWGGISMDLWKEVARRLHLDYQVKELTAKDLADPDKLAALDVFVSLNVTAERDAQLDLTHAFYSTGLAIAVAPKSNDSIGATFEQIFTAKFGKLMAALLGLLAAVGAAIWLFERKRNEQFGGSVAHGIGAGVWWSAVTMTTVGYGDKAPVTFVGRALGHMRALA